jgi:threonine dehydratase
MLTPEDLKEATRIVRAHVPVTPAYRWPLLEAVTGTTTWVKQENATPTGAFKVRGGPVFVDRLLRSRRTVPGLVAATRGNHGQSVTYAGREHGVPVTIVVPEGNSPDKNASMAGFGAELVVHGRDFQEAFENAMALADEHGLVPVPSFHRDLVAGVATGAAELHADEFGSPRSPQNKCRMARNKCRIASNKCRIVGLRAQGLSASVTRPATATISASNGW